MRRREVGRHGAIGGQRSSTEDPPTPSGSRSPAPVAPSAQLSTQVQPIADGLDPVRALAVRLRAVGVLAVAAPIISQARPAGTSLLSVLRVLVTELAHEWRAAAEALPVLHPDRLQLHSAAALLNQGSTAGHAFASARVDGLCVARAVALREAVQAPDDGRSLDEGNLLLDRTWAVLHDLRRGAAAEQLTDLEDDDALREHAALVHSATDVEADDGTRLPVALDVAATAGALVGLLAPWLPPSRVDAVARIDALMNAVSAMARRHQDETWWVAMTELSRCAASLSVATCFAVSAHAGAPAAAAAQTLAERRFAEAVDGALAAVRPLVAGVSVPRPASPNRPLVLTGGIAGTASAGRGTPALSAVPEPPQPSPSQQARAAAERAAAERAATQQAFVERATATRAAARASAGHGPGPAAGVAAVGQDGSHGDDDRSAVSAAPTSVPPIAQVRADLGEVEEPVRLGIWDTLMGPR